VKIVIAPDSFKGSLSAAAVADAIARGVLKAAPDAEVDLIPLADGGEGTVETMMRATGGRIASVPATDPLGNRMESSFGVLGDGLTAVVEMAAASGLALVPEDKRNPMLTTSFGAGELVRAALDSGCTRLILAIGGSATNDGGVGAAQALGVSFRDALGGEIGFGGGELRSIASIDASGIDSRLKDVEVIVACDVDNPLTGEHGASAVFGPQKGATPDMIVELDAGLRNLADVIRRDVGVDIEHIPGAGAAGGMGAASVAFMGGRLTPGIDMILDAVGFAGRAKGASLVITGEGRVDAQTIRGKAVRGVLSAAEYIGVPALVLAGAVDEGGYGIASIGRAAVFSIAPGPITLEESRSNVESLLSWSAEQSIRLFSFGHFENKDCQLLPTVIL